MFDLGWTEMLLIGIVALIVVGPKDLPMMFRKAGQFIGKAKGMAREFSKAMDDAADESGMRDVAKSLKSVADPKQMGLDKIRDAADGLKPWKPGTETAKLAAERAEAAAKLREQTTDKALERKAEAAKVAAGQADPAPDAKPAAAQSAKQGPKTGSAPKSKAAAPKKAASKSTLEKAAPRKTTSAKAAPAKAAAAKTAAAKTAAAKSSPSRTPKSKKTADPAAQE